MMERGAGASRDGAEAPLALELEGLARKFGRHWALRGVSLRLAPGELVAVVGHNGSGKTTLLRTVATALRPTRGRGRVYGRDLVEEADAVRACTGYLGHESGLYGDLTAGENLVFAQRMRGGEPDRSAVQSALGAVGLRGVMDERVRAFSAGMRRRAALARLMLSPPRLLLLDEPFASLDEDGVRRMTELLRRTRSRGDAALVATHGPERAGDVIDRVVEMNQGRIVRRPRGAAGRGDSGADVPLSVVAGRGSG